MDSSNTSAKITSGPLHILNSTIKIQSAPGRIYVSDEVYNFIHIIVAMGIGCLLSILGIISNVINCIIFCKQGVKDSVTISYILLSFWDGCTFLMTLICIILSSIERLFPVEQIDFGAVFYVYFAYARSMTHIMSTLVTVYVSVELCICITIPLKVKLMFTKSRCVVIHVAMVIFTVACNCPAWATQGLQWKFNPRFNSTRLGLWLAKERPTVEIFMAIFTGDVIQVTAQALSVICAVLLISGIKKSAKFRMQSNCNLNKPKEILTPKSSDNLPAISAIVATKQESSGKKVRSKNYTKLAKITVVITVLFLVFNIPVMVVSVSRTIVPALNNTNLINVLYTIVYASTVISPNMSIFIYYNGSKKFKNIFRSLACFKKRT